MTESPVLSPIKKTARKKRKKPWPWRRTVQIAFAALNILLGWQFYRFVHAAQTTTSGVLPTRPPGVEGWLPISGLMGAIDWFVHGALNTIHPAATMLLLVFTVLAFCLRKSFCGWLCPVGLLSESLAMLGRKIFQRNFRPPRVLDRILMGIKYALLGLFLFAFVVMGMEGINRFLQSPYNRVSDVKMMLFFAQIGMVGGSILLGLAVGSIFIEGFWCRYFCPYGAYLGLFSWLSPVKVRRNIPSCIDCGKCDRACPAHLTVMSKPQIISVECNGCMECVQVCPVPDTLHLGLPTRKFSPLQMGVAVLLVFTLFYLGANALGHWRSSLTDEEYRYHISRLDGPEYGHPGR
jgi:polyferredoxin